MSCSIFKRLKRRFDCLVFGDEVPQTRSRRGTVFLQLDARTPVSKSKTSLAKSRLRASVLGQQDLVEEYKFCCLSKVLS